MKTKDGAENFNHGTEVKSRNNSYFIQKTYVNLFTGLQVVNPMKVDKDKRLEVFSPPFSNYFSDQNNQLMPI
jgi:hypothetical protein